MKKLFTVMMLSLIFFAAATGTIFAVGTALGDPGTSRAPQVPSGQSPQPNP